jgi:hypothetical protein
VSNLISSPGFILAPDRLQWLGYFARMLLIVILCPFIKKCKHVARAAIRAPLAAFWRVFHWFRLASHWLAAHKAWDRLASGYHWE